MMGTNGREPIEWTERTGVRRMPLASPVPEEDLGRAPLRRSAGGFCWWNGCCTRVHGYSSVADSGIKSAMDRALGFRSSEHTSIELCSRHLEEVAMSLVGASGRKRIAWLKEHLHQPPEAGPFLREPA